MPHIRKIRVAGTALNVPVEIYPCSFEDVVFWQRRIHDRHIAPAGGIGSDWDWPACFLGCHFVEQLKRRQALSFQLRVDDGNGIGFPVAQALFSLRYPWPADKRHQCVFIWFIAAAPRIALLDRGIPHRDAILAPLLDIAVQVSVAHGLCGRIGLHAALGTREESDDLVRRYKTMGLSQTARRRWWLFRFPHRWEDGRLFYFKPEDALSFAAKQDDLR